MMSRKSLLGVTALIVVLLLSACTAVQAVPPAMSTIPPATPEQSTIPPAAPPKIDESATDAGADMPAPTAAFVLPDGNTCLFAGTGATLAFDGKRVTYTCDIAPEGKMVGILGDPVPSGETEWQVEVATLAHGDGGFTLESSETIEFTAWMISLSHGARCLHAGFGATMGFDDSGRLDYTCNDIAADAIGPANGGDWGIFGQLTNAGEGVWMANRIEFGSSAGGFTELDNAQVAVSTISGVDPNAASAPSAEMGASVLAGTSWHWVRTEYGDGSFVEALDPSRYTLTFNQDGTISAQLDCNRGMGEFTEDNAMLAFGPMASTMMACPEDSQVDLFAQDLGNVASFVLQDGHLFLAIFADTGIMEFAPAESDMEAEGAVEGTSMLAGTSWQWIQTQSGDGSIIEAADPTRYTLTFNEDGSLSAQLDCNKAMGSFTDDGGMLSFGPIASTRMACPGDSQADVFAQQLDSIVSYVLQDGHLFLAQFADSGIMEFAPIE